MHRINFTAEQARRVVATVPPGTFYYREACRCLNELGQQLGIDHGGLGYNVLNDDDGNGI